jgi:hypothetical protein
MKEFKITRRTGPDSADFRPGKVFRGQAFNRSNVGIEHWKYPVNSTGVLDKIESSVDGTPQIRFPTFVFLSSLPPVVGSPTFNRPPGEGHLESLADQ